MVTDPVERLKSFAPKLTIKAYPTGHWIQLEAPERFNRDLQDFLDA
jgi:pimeloyl-ACP methyl ester carboxylesterase